MSIARLKELRNNKKFNSPLAFLPTGKDIKVLVDAIEESQPSTLLDSIKQREGYGAKFHIPLSGYDIKDIVDSIACPPDNLKIIRNKLRYNTKHEYILTGKDVKILLDAISDVSCLAPPIVYNIYTAQLTVDNPITDILVMGALGSASGFSAQTLIGGIQGNFEDAGGGLGNGGGDYGIWIKSEVEPVGWTWNGNPVTWFDQGLAVFESCQTTGAVTIDTSLWSFRYANYLGMQIEVSSGSLAYNNGTFNALFLTECIMFFGTNTTVFTDIKPNEITLTVYNTYANITQIRSEDFVNPVQVDVVTVCP